MVNGDENPWWLSAIYKVGIPSAIAVYLTYFVTSTLGGALTNIQINQSNFEEQIRLHAVDNSYILKETNQMRMILQQICANTATNKTDRNDCFK